MKKEFKFPKLFFTLFIFVLFSISTKAFCVENISVAALQKGNVTKKTENFFDLFAIAESLLNQENNSKIQSENEKSKIQFSRYNFFETTQKFNQGNVAVAYDDYFKTISELNNDFALLNFAKFLYRNGLFSLAEISISKIRNQDKLKFEIMDLKKSFENTYPLDKNEEIYLAKALVSIYFDNSAQEITYELNKKETLMEKSDYANYVMAQAFFELKQYNQALNYIKSAININPNNVSYSFFRAKILFANKNYTQALKIAEYPNFSNLNFKNDFLILKQNILSNTVKNPSDKKYHSALAAYYEGNYYKAIINARAAISLNKKNYAALNILAKSQLKIGEIDPAKHNFNVSNSINKSNTNALIGLGDCEFIATNFAQANTYYKKAYSGDKNNKELILKLILVNEILGDKKAIQKIEKSTIASKKMTYFENFEIATTLLNNIYLTPEITNTQSYFKRPSNSLRSEYLKISLAENPFFTNAWLELVNSNINSERAAESFIRIATLNGELSYYYYYNLALLEYSQKNYEKTVEYLNTSSGLNPQFEPANQMLLNLKIK